jgi:hypothetical protein
LAESHGLGNSHLLLDPKFSLRREVWTVEPEAEVPCHLSIATGSLMELEIQIQISARLSYLDSKTLNDVLARTDEIGKMLSGLRGSLNPQSSILNPE